MADEENVRERCAANNVSTFSCRFKTESFCQTFRWGRHFRLSHKEESRRVEGRIEGAFSKHP